MSMMKKLFAAGSSARKTNAGPKPSPDPFVSDDSSPIKLFSWGADEFAQLGHFATNSDSIFPSQVVTEDRFVVAVACGESHTLALTNDFQVLGTGNNASGQIQPISLNSSLSGTGLNKTAKKTKTDQTDTKSDEKVTEFHTLTPIFLPETLQVVEVSCGDNFSAVLTSSGKVFTFGDNSFAQLGHSFNSFNKTHIFGLKEVDSTHFLFSKVICGPKSLFLLTRQRNLLVCGDNTNFQLSNNLTLQNIIISTQNTKYKIVPQLAEVSGPLKSNPVNFFSVSKNVTIVSTISGKCYLFGKINSKKGEISTFETISDLEHVVQNFFGEFFVSETALNENFILLMNNLKDSVYIINLNDLFIYKVYEKELFNNEKILQVSVSNDLGFILTETGKVLVLSEKTENLKAFGFNIKNLTELEKSLTKNYKLFEMNNFQNVFKMSSNEKSFFILTKNNSENILKNKLNSFVDGTFSKFESFISISNNEITKFNSEKLIAKNLNQIKSSLFDISSLNSSFNDFLLNNNFNKKNINHISKNKKISVQKSLKNKLSKQKSQIEFGNFESSNLNIPLLLGFLEKLTEYAKDEEFSGKFPAKSLLTSLISQIYFYSESLTEENQLKSLFILLFSPLTVKFCLNEYEILIFSIFKLPFTNKKRLFSWIFNDFLNISSENSDFQTYDEKVKLFISLFVEPVIKILDKNIKSKKFGKQVFILCKYLFCLKQLLSVNNLNGSSLELNLNLTVETKAFILESFYLKKSNELSFQYLAEVYTKYRNIINKKIVLQRQKEMDRARRNVLNGFNFLLPFLSNTNSNGTLNDTESEHEFEETEEEKKENEEEAEKLNKEREKREKAMEELESQTFGLHLFSPDLLLMLSEPLDETFFSDPSKLIQSSADLVLFKFPFLIPPDTKRKFMQLDEWDAHRFNAATAVYRGQTQVFELVVNRSNLLTETVQNLTALISSNAFQILRKPLRIKFINEEGLDAGGVKKEFFLLLSQDLFSPIFGHFLNINSKSSENFLWFSNTLESLSEYNKENISYKEYLSKVELFSKIELELFKVIGVIIGLAVYNDTLLDVLFPVQFYKLLLNEINLNAENIQSLNFSVEEFESFDSQSAKQLKFIQTASETELKEMDLTFEITENIFGEYKNIELCQNGANKVVTAQNKTEYINLFIKYKMFSPLITKKAKQLVEGFNIIIPRDQAAFNLFSANELELLICGTRELDFNILEQKSEYEGGYSKEHKTVRTFWKLVLDKNFSEDSKKKLLKFVTGSSRAPVGGLKNIKWKIQRAGPDSEQLPTSHTCFNTLMLPEYATEEKMKKLLLLAIENSEGFGLE